MRSRATWVLLLAVLAGCKRSESIATPAATSSSADAASSEVPCSATLASASAAHSAASAAASPPPIASVDAGALPPPKDITAAVARLADKRQDVRDAAALEIRAAIAANPAAARDKGEAFWRAKLDAIPVGTSRAEYVRLTGAQPRGTIGGGGGSTANFRLDDFWVSSAYFETRTMTLMKHGVLVRSPRDVDVDLGATFTGHALTYLVDGTKSVEIDSVKGDVTHRRVYHPNETLSWEQGYSMGRPHGPYRAFYGNGQKEAECSYIDGQEVGLCVHWWPNGKKKSESTSIDGKQNGRSTSWREDGTREVEFDYRDGVEIGQAAYDECDRPIYAHGSFSDGGGT